MSTHSRLSKAFRLENSLFLEFRENILTQLFDKCFSLVLFYSPINFFYKYNINIPIRNFLNACKHTLINNSNTNAGATSTNSNSNTILILII